ncbi:MAG TPA: hypothetical protein VIX73_20705 [Kofleriaceae bacterium]
MTARRASLAGIGAVVLAACGLEPDVGARFPNECDEADSQPSSPVSFAGDIRPLINRQMGGCGCHLPSSNGAGTGTQISGLDLSSLTTLRSGGFNSGSRMVVAGQPCESIMYLKLEDAPPFGSRMPLNGPPFWNSDELKLLHDWIAEGAKDN